MNRRDALKTLALSSAAIPLFGAANSTVPFRAIEPNALRLKFGTLELYIFSDGTNIQKNPYPLIAPKRSEDEFNQARKECYLDQHPISFGLNILMIKKENQYILFDTGNGLGKNENVGRLIEQMQASGIEPNFVTDIILTHAHGDHIGGIILPDGNFAFKNAKYYINQIEFDYWMKEKNEETKKILNKIRPLTNFIQTGKILFNCIKVEATPGHTPGHLAFEIFQAEKTLKLKHIADTVHSPIVIRYPEYGIKFDQDFDLAIQTRQRVLEDAYQNRTLLFAMHLPWPGIGFIGKRDEKYDWFPLAFGSNLKQIEL